jgi:transmembrane 9 superfamily member 3
VGESEESGGTIRHYIWTHKKFDIGYNGNQIVDVNLTSENKVLLDLNAKMPFTYEVNWRKSSIKYEDRFDKYLDPNFFQHRVSKITSYRPINIQAIFVTLLK